MQRRAPVTRAIDDVHLVSLLREVLEPARASIRGFHPVGALPAAAMHEHHGERMPHLRRNHVLDVHLLPADVGAARRFGTPDVHPHVAPLGEVERSLLGRCGSSLRQPGGVGAPRRERPDRGRRGTGHAQRGGAAHEVAAADTAGSEVGVEADDLNILRRAGLCAHVTLRVPGKGLENWRGKHPANSCRCQRRPGGAGPATALACVPCRGGHQTRLVRAGLPLVST